MFVFEKRLLDKFPKKDREAILEAMKKGKQDDGKTHILHHRFVLGVQQLAKIKHPRVLSLQHPLEESRCDRSFVLRIDHFCVCLVIVLHLPLNLVLLALPIVLVFMII